MFYAPPPLIRIAKSPQRKTLMGALRYPRVAAAMLIDKGMMIALPRAR
jgi:hypothetical protein